MHQLTGSVNADSSPEIANSFNESFASVGTKFVSNFPTAENMHTFQSVPHSMFVGDTNGTEITELISKLDKSSSGIDKINNKLLKSCSPNLLSNLVQLISLSLRQGVFSHPLKVAEVTPLFKGNDKREVNNHRPISLLNSFSKIY